MFPEVVDDRGSEGEEAEGEEAEAAPQCMHDPRLRTHIWNKNRFRNINIEIRFIEQQQHRKPVIDQQQNIGMFLEHREPNYRPRVTLKNRFSRQKQI